MHSAALRIACLGLVFASLAAGGLHIGVAVFPETGHLNPLLAIVEAAAKKGHTTTIYAPDFFMKTCLREISSMPYAACHDVGHYNVTYINEPFMQRVVRMGFIESLGEVTAITVDYNTFLVTAIHAALDSNSTLVPDVLLVDFGAWSASAVGDLRNIPAVMIWPLTLQFPTESNPSIPALGSAISSRMSWSTRLYNYCLQRLYLTAMSWVTEGQYNKIRASIGASAVDSFDLYYRRLIVSPSVYGLDLAQPLCPNVHPVGFLARMAATSELSGESVPADWQKFMDGCDAGIVYINMGSVAVLPDEWLVRVEDAAVAFSTSTKKCVVWKISKRQLDVLKPTSRNARLQLTTYIPFSPRILLAHKNTKVFVTHCGDTSVYEAVQNLVPMVGIPLFADQADMCARVQDSGIGISLEKFTFSTESLVHAVDQVLLNEATARQKLELLRSMGEILGGPARAAEIIEIAANNKDIMNMLYCTHPNLPWYQRHDVDVIVITAFFLFVITSALSAVLRLAWWAVQFCMGSRRSQKSEKEKRSKKVD